MVPRGRPEVSRARWAGTWAGRDIPFRASRYGITEAHDSKGREFGRDRFADFVIRHRAGGLAAPETLRRLVHAVLDHHDGRLNDDATVLLCEWHGDAGTTPPVRYGGGPRQDTAGRP